MITKLPKKSLYTSNHGWLKSKFLFSFADYYDPTNIEWGALRVFNDDTIAAHSGFPMHNHKEMEIVTIMLSGTLTHHDSMGNTRTITRGFIQRMSAGTGVTHSEMNDGDDTVKLYQLWFYPKESGVVPSYEEKEFSILEKEGLHLLISQTGENESMKINSRARLFYGNLKQGNHIIVPVMPDEHILIYVKEGSLITDGVTADEGDQLRITLTNDLSLYAESDSEFVMIIS